MATATDKKECILKLRLAGVGGSPQIRRVRLGRIHNSDGKVCYKKLVHLAIRYAFPTASSFRSDGYEVILTYYDEDNDCVTIASTEELLDAIDQFSVQENPVLRITTDVKRKEGVPEATEKATTSRALKDEDEESEEDAEVKKEEPATTNSVPTVPALPRTNHLQSLVESFVSILAAAIVTLQNQVAEAAKAAEEAAARTAETSAVKKTPAVTDEKMEEVAEQLAKEVVANMEEIKTEEKETQKEQEETQEEERPFIHGRHTCDGCLCTPIIGLRYHSTNLPDYDLCSKCRDNYKGSEIEFEAVQLDRDRPFQERWHRKRARFAERGGRCGPNSRGPNSRGHGHGPGPHHNFRRGPPFHHHNGPHSFRGGCRRRGPPFRWQQQPSMDDALKEAIRRSLEEAQVKTEPTAEASATEATAPLAPTEPSSSETVATEAESVASSEAVEPAKEVITSVVVGSSSSNLPVATPIKETSAEENEVAAEDDSEITVEPDDETTADSLDTKDVASQTTEEKSTEPEDSFSSEAAGHGDAAEQLGQTLDQCAQAIDAMVSELDRETKEAEDLEVESTTEEEASTGEKIVEGDDVDEKDDVSAAESSTKSEDEWQVVDQDAQIAGDEVIARAAQMLGSALFQNDLEASSLTTSSNQMGSSDNFSVPSSVPTVSSEIPIAVLDRWTLHLNQLHELGFFDDRKSVDILERLTAARIGSEDDDEVSVSHVVDALLKN